jgi:8-oxo-dGTP pyrophosphatase MutT (NUDIX family)
VNDLAKHIARIEGVQNSPNQRPKAAATLIVIDRSNPTPKIMFGRRHESHAFLPGKFVFPGGRVDPQDHTMPYAAPLHPMVESKLNKNIARQTRTTASAIALAAIRETFEETGMLFGVKSIEERPVPRGVWSKFASYGYYPDLSTLHFVTRAITPPRYPRRFDTRFFAVDAKAIAHRIEQTTDELIELSWVPISNAYRIDLPVITGIVLRELEARVAAGFAHDLPVPFYRMERTNFVRELL